MTKHPKNPPAQSFESALSELEQVVAAMEAGQMPLEESLAAYRRGTELLKYCQNALQDAQQQVKILEGGNLTNYSADGGISHGEQ